MIAFPRYRVVLCGLKIYTYSSNVYYNFSIGFQLFMLSFYYFVYPSAHPDHSLLSLALSLCLSLWRIQNRTSSDRYAFFASVLHC